MLETESEEPKALFEAKIFKFPFTQVKLNIKTLKELQNPITTKLIDIEVFLTEFQQEFPHEIFPIKKEIKKEDYQKEFESANQLKK